MRRREAPTTGAIQPKPKPPAAPSGITPPAWRTGVIRETCSCGASASVPDTPDGRQYVMDWRHSHRHTQPRPEPASLGKPVHDADDKPQVTTGELRDNATQDVPFGFFPPVVEARQP